MSEERQLSFRFCPICGGELITGRMDFPISNDDLFGRTYHRIGNGYYDISNSYYHIEGRYLWEWRPDETEGYISAPEEDDSDADDFYENPLDQDELYKIKAFAGGLPILEKYGETEKSEVFCEVDCRETLPIIAGYCEICGKVFPELEVSKFNDNGTI